MGWSLDHGSTISNVGFESSPSARYHDASGVTATVLSFFGSPSGLSGRAITLTSYTDAVVILPSSSISHDFRISGCIDFGSGVNPRPSSAAGAFSTFRSIAPASSGLAGLSVVAVTAAPNGTLPFTATTQNCIAVTRGSFSFTERAALVMVICSGVTSQFTSVAEPRV